MAFVDKTGKLIPQNKIQKATNPPAPVPAQKIDPRNITGKGMIDKHKKGVRAFFG